MRSAKHICPKETTVADCRAGSGAVEESVKRSLGQFVLRSSVSPKRYHQDGVDGSAVGRVGGAGPATISIRGDGRAGGRFTYFSIFQIQRCRPPEPSLPSIRPSVHLPNDVSAGHAIDRVAVGRRRQDRRRGTEWRRTTTTATHGVSSASRIQQGTQGTDGPVWWLLIVTRFAV